MSTPRGHDGNPVPPAPRFNLEGQLRPPAGSPEPADPKTGLYWLLALLGLGVVAGVTLLVLFPNLTREWIFSLNRDAVPQTREITSSTAADPPKSAKSKSGATDAAPEPNPPRSADIGEGGETNLEENEAASALQHYLRIRAKPELAGAEIWGNPEWNDAEAAAIAGEQALRAAKFGPARQNYARATILLKTVIADRDERLEATLAAAAAVLQQNGAQEAMEKFQLALAIDPGNELAAAGLSRARVRQEVLQNMTEGEQAEGEGRLEEALAAYDNAIKLDSDFSAAVEAHRRLARYLAEQNFNNAMSRALAALDAGQLELAEKALIEARRLRPEDPALRDLRTRLIQTRQQSRLALLRNNAAAQVRAEQWQEAIDSYRQALAIDANIAFAVQGLRLAQERARLHQQLDHYLGDPDRLQAKAPFENAQTLLAFLAAPIEGELQLKRKIAALQKLVAQAGRKIVITLHSDGQTEVVIHGVARFGRFAQQTVALRPGTYTIVGSRNGYRDVRRSLTIKGSSDSLAVAIRCMEPL